MTEKLRERLDRLREEYATGMKTMAEIEKKQEELRAVLLRISGAIQVIEELLASEKPPPPPSSSEPESN
jgi:hypothetical protein